MLFLSSVWWRLCPGRAKSSETAVPRFLTRAQRLALLGPPLLIEGEDAAAYDQVLAGICAAEKPVDFIDEMFIADVAALEWDVLRWRRLKWSWLQALGREALEGFLAEQLEYDLYSETFAEYLAQILQESLPKDEADSALTLAHKCARNEADAVEKVKKILHMDKVLDDARALKAKELVQEYVRRQPDAVTLIDELLAAAGVSIDTLTADALANKLDYIERIDHLITIAESRRNAILREIDRHRAVLGETLRRSVQEIEDGEFKLIEPTSAKGKHAA
jgi:hypothetical protein